MIAKSISREANEVKALRIVLITLLLLYGAVSITAAVFMAKVFPTVVHRHTERLILSSISIFCHSILPGVIFFFIAYCIFKLIGLISRGEPFIQASPQNIRRIGYAVFILAAADAVVNSITAFTTPGFPSEKFVWILYSGLGTLLLGFGFMVIAKVLETAVRLQQDQNLTV
jgi:hypothetical protein